MQYKYLLILLLVYIFILCSNWITNQIINSEYIKNIITKNINKYAKKIDLSKIEINPGYMTTIFDLYLYIYNLKNDDYSITIYDLYHIELNLKKLKGYFKCKFTSGPSDYFSLGDEITINFDNIILNYTLSIEFYPFKVGLVRYHNIIYYNVESEKTIINFFVNKGLGYYKNTIKQKLSEHLENVPNIIQNKMGTIVKKYDYIFQILRYYILIFVLCEILYFTFLYYVKLNFEKVCLSMNQLINEINKSYN